MSKFIPKAAQAPAAPQQSNIPTPGSGKESSQLTLAAVSEVIISLKPSISNSEPQLKLISNFLAQQYSRGVARPDHLQELCKNRDTATNAIEKRVGMFIEKLVTGQEQHALKIARERVGRVSKENVQQALREAVFCKAVQLSAGMGPIVPESVQSALVGFGCIDGLLAYTNILVEKVQAASEYKEVVSIVEILSQLDKEVLKSKNFALIGLDE